MKAQKSTLIKILSGVVERDQGVLRLNGHDNNPSSPQDALRAGVGTVYQDPQIVPSLTVAENVFVGRFPISGAGLLRRNEMRLLILDEPTSTLTPSEVSRLFRLVDKLRGDGASVLLVSHKLEEIEANADAVTCSRRWWDASSCSETGRTSPITSGPSTTSTQRRTTDARCRVHPRRRTPRGQARADTRPR